MRLTTKREIMGFLFVLPALVWFLVFVVYPAVMTVYMSMHEWYLIVGERRFIGLENYSKLFGDYIFLRSLGNTAYLVVGFTSLEFSISLGLALLIIRLKKSFWSGTLRLTVFLPLAFPMVAACLVWGWMYYPTKIGLLNYFLGLLKIPNIHWLTDIKLAMPSVILTTLWKSLGYDTIIFIAGLNSIPEIYYDAAKVDGARGWQLFKNVTLPLLKPQIIFVLTMCVIYSSKVFDQIIALTSGGPGLSTTVVTYYMYNKAFIHRQMGYASSISIVLFLIVFVFSYSQMRFLTKEFEY